VNDSDNVRLDRLEAYAAIRQLAVSYAVHVDARDLDALVSLYVEDVQVGRRTGRAALRASFLRFLGGNGIFRTTIHFVGNHVVDLDPTDPDRATGVVYCRAEHEIADEWVIVVLQYWDRYVRRDGQWLFADRQMKPFYAVDVLERPNGAERVKRQVTDAGVAAHAEIPESLPTWNAFWEELAR
jgi:ketosteroid isomerase-like protein